MSKCQPVYLLLTKDGSCDEFLPACQNKDSVENWPENHSFLRLHAVDYYTIITGNILGATTSGDGKWVSHEGWKSTDILPVNG